MQPDSSTSDRGPRFSPDEDWVLRAMRLANSDPEFAESAAWLHATVLLQVGEQRFCLDTWHGSVVHAQSGTPLTGWDFAIVGDTEAWAELTESKSDLGEATTSVGSSLTIDGNQVLAATHWAAVLRLMEILGIAAGRSS